MYKKMTWVSRKLKFKNIINCSLEYLFLGVLFSIIAFSAGTDPTNFACSALNSTVLQVTWTQTSSLTVDGYHLDIERVDGLKIEYGLPSIELNDRTYESYTYHGLGKFATYNVTIHSYLSSGTNNTDYVITCQTSSDIPDASNFNFSCTGISTSEITCVWDTLDTVYWNGNPVAYILGYLRYTNDIYTYVNLSTNVVTHTISNLYFDTWYVIQLQTQNDAGLSPFTSSPAKTLGWPVTVENKTRYFCYETIPGTLVWSWEEMPCTVYVGIILVFMLLTLIFMLICCCMCCCGKKSESNKSNVAINVFNEQGDNGGNDGYDDYDDDDDEKDTSSDDEDSEDYDYDSEGNPTQAAILAKKKRKMAEANKGGASGSEDSEYDTDEDELEYETSEVETGPDEEYESSEGDEDLDEEERAAKKEKKLAAIAAAKELKEKKREEKAKRKAEKDKEREVNKAKRDEERAKRKAAKDEEKRKQKIERDQKNETTKDEKDKNNAERKKRKELKRLKKQNENDGSDETETESDYESDEFSDTDDFTENEDEDNNVAKITNYDKKKDISKRKLPNKKALVGKAKLSTVNEKSKNRLQANKNDNKLNNSDSKDNKVKTKENSKGIKDKELRKANKDKEKNSVNDKKKERSRKRYSDSDDFSDGSGTDYYEDWNPDAEDNPETNVTRVNVKDNNKTTEQGDKIERDKNSKGKNLRKATEKKGDEKDTTHSSKRNTPKQHKEKDTDAENLTSKHKRKRKQKGNQSEIEDSDNYDSDDSDNYDNVDSDNYDSDDYDSEDYDDSDDYNSDDYDSDHFYSDEGKHGAKRKKLNKSNDKDKKPGFFGRLLGNFNMSSGGNNKQTQSKTTNQNKSNGLSDWESEEEYNSNEQNVQGNEVARSGLNGSGFGRSGYPGRAKNINNPKSVFLKGNSNTTTDFGDWGSDDDIDTIVHKGNNNEYSNSYAMGGNMQGKNKKRLSDGTNGTIFIPKNQNQYNNPLMSTKYASMDLNPYGTSHNKNPLTSKESQFLPSFGGNYSSVNRYPDRNENTMPKTKPDERSKFDALFKVNSRRRNAAKTNRANPNDKSNYGLGKSGMTASQSNNYGDGEDIFSINNRAQIQDQQTISSKDKSQKKYDMPISGLKEASNNSHNAINSNDQFYKNNRSTDGDKSISNENGVYVKNEKSDDKHSHGNENGLSKYRIFEAGNGINGDADNSKSDRTQNKIGLEKDRPFQINMNAANGNDTDINNRLQNGANDYESNRNDNDLNQNRSFGEIDRPANVHTRTGDKSGKLNTAMTDAANDALNSNKYLNANAKAPFGTHNNRYPGDNQPLNHSDSLSNPSNLQRNHTFGTGGNHLTKGNKSKKLVSFRNNVPQIVGIGNTIGKNQGRNGEQIYNEGNNQGTNGVHAGPNYNGGYNSGSNNLLHGQNLTGNASPIKNELTSGRSYTGGPNPGINGFPSGQNYNKGNISSNNELPKRPNSNGRTAPGSNRFAAGTSNNEGTKPGTNGLPNGPNNNGKINTGTNGLPTRLNSNGETNQSLNGLPTGTNLNADVHGADYNESNDSGRNRFPTGPIQNAIKNPSNNGLYHNPNNSGVINQRMNGLPIESGHNGRTSAGNNRLTETNGLQTGHNYNGDHNPTTNGLHSGPYKNGGSNPNINGVPNKGLNAGTGTKYDGGSNLGANVLPSGSSYKRGNNTSENRLPSGPNYAGGDNPVSNRLPAGRNDNTGAKSGTNGLPTGPNSLKPDPSAGVNAPTGSDESDDVFISDTDIVLPKNDNNRQLRSPVGRFINKPAWDKTKPDNSSNEKRKGSKTPVKELVKTPRRVTLMEPEPVFETDRLAKKFPFLSTGDSVKDSNANDDKPKDGMRKNQSDSNLNKLLGKGKPFGGLPKIASDPNITAKENEEKNAGSLNADTRDKIFYGFGVGKWRLVAAKWLNTWKMKRRPVKTAQSSWD